MSRSDPLKDARAKCRYILELRYAPLVQTFDRRGRVLELIYPLFEAKTGHWKVDNAQVAIADDFEKNSKLVAVGHLRSSISYEDPATQGEFTDDCLRLLAALKEVFPEGLSHLRRIGFRAVSVFRPRAASSFPEVYSLVRDRFLTASAPTTLAFSDCRVTFSSDTSNVTVGPCRAGENWVKAEFTHPDEHMPAFGIGLDVDSFATEITCRDTNDLKRAMETVSSLTFRVETEILSGLI